MAFLVSDPAGNPKTVDGIPVIPLSQFETENVEIVIATPENYHAEIAAELEKRGFSSYICMDSKKKRR